jgi:hypothetical protein
MTGSPSDPGLGSPAETAGESDRQGVDEPAPEPDSPPASRSHVRRTLSEGWRLARLVYRDPEHVAERLALFNAKSLGEDSIRWAQRVRAEHVGGSRAVIAEQLRTDSAKVAAIDGAIAGTPFLIALVPGYLSYLRQEGRMLLRTAALYDRDPRDTETAAEVLALRGVHPTVDAARSALLAVQTAAMPAKPTARRPWRTWVRSVYVLLIFGGFLSAPSDERKEGAHAWVKTGLGFLFGAAIWVITWVFPLSFMIAMAWGCDSNARDLGRRALIYYADDAEDVPAALAAAKQRRAAERTARQMLGALLLFLSVALPIAFIALVNHERQSTGVTPLTAVGGLVALSLVIATAVVASRR